MTAMNAHEYSGRGSVSKVSAPIVDFLWIEEPRGDNFHSLRSDLAKEAAAIPFVTSGANLLNLQQDRVGIAIDINGPDHLRVAALLAFSPEATAATAVINSPTGA